MSVKIISTADQKEIYDADQKEIKNSTDTSGLNPGTRFLKQKQQEIRGTEEAKQIAAWLHEQVSPLIREEQLSLCPTEKLIVSAAHLVCRERVAEYRGILANARKTRPELHFLVSGPWPPYTFCNIELEFKSGFGVS
jgi:hypothetical protein